METVYAPRWMHPVTGVPAKRGDFEPLIAEDLFYRVQGVLSGRVPSTTPQQRAHPDFQLRAFVRCAFCGRGLTGSWSRRASFNSAARLRRDILPVACLAVARA
jgi:hypothetical protein